MGYLTHGATAGGKTYDLLPCPFCGGEAVFHEYTGRFVEVALANRCDVPAMIKCERCGAMLSFNTGTRSTRRDAADAWNRRAERTCRVEVERRKLSQTQTAVVKTCSGCGFEFGVEKENTLPFEVTLNVVVPPNYCPNCGAKVLGE